MIPSVLSDFVRRLIRSNWHVCNGGLGLEGSELELRVREGRRGRKGKRRIECVGQRKREH